MSSAICFSLDRSKILSSGNELSLSLSPSYKPCDCEESDAVSGSDDTVWACLVLTHYHTLLHFDALKIYSHRKHYEKRRNCLLEAISLFLTMYSTLNDTYFSF